MLRLMILLFFNSLSKRRFIAISHTAKNIVYNLISCNSRRNCIKGSLCNKALNADELGMIHKNNSQ
ncbi:MAG TPA: hypothetical protein DCY06_10290 [Bacteroidetes bacterium]|nr:hypothetical protein [Bacteroidota bacterium]